MRRSGHALLWLATLASPAAAQDHPIRPEPADHVLQASPTPTDPVGDPVDPHAHGDTLTPAAPTLLEGYGGGGFTITTRVPEAQAFFSNGMELGAAFAHSAALAAMEEAVRLDPACAMCLWGRALVTGPTINFGLSADERKPLYALLRRADRLAAKGGTAKETALISALVERFKPKGKTAQRDAAYAAKMAKVQARFPDDREIAVLAADALMVDAFNNYANLDEAKLRRAMVLLESVLARDPDHTPAIHFYIHVAEVLGEPAKAEPYADRLAGLAPRAAHLVHMPSHTWYWVGRYQEAAETNLRAVEIGKENAARLGLPEPEGVWGLPYHAHNVIFGLGGALMSGDATIALALARPMVAATLDEEDQHPISQLLAASGYFALARFDPASVDDVPEPKMPYLKAAWHYARGEAAAWRGDAAAVRAEMDLIPESVETPEEGESTAAEQMLGIVRGVLAGRIAMIEGDPRAAEAAFRQAAEIEETEAFNDFADPPAFWYPVRRDVAVALLAAGDAAGAKAEAQASLRLRVKDPAAEQVLAAAEAALAAAP